VNRLMTLVVFVIFSYCQPKAIAEIANSDEMHLVCQNFLTYIVHKNGTWSDSNNPTIVSDSILVDNNIQLAHCYSISPCGFVVVPILGGMGISEVVVGQFNICRPT